MKILVTGATGFVGRSLMAEFDARGFDTVAVGGPKNSDAGYSINVSDMAQVQTLEREQRVDAVVHAAGIAHRFGRVSDDEFHRVNVAGVENIAEIARGLGAKHFLLFSSTLVYGRRDRPVPIAEDDECRPPDAYGRSKLEGERAARRICEAAGMDLTIFRPAPIMGEGSKGNFARLTSAIDRRRFIWVGRGENQKSVVYVGDVANAAAEVLARGGRGTQVFNVAADAVKMKDIVNAISGALGKKVPPLHLPAWPVSLACKVSAGLSATLDTWLGDDVYSNEQLHKIYGCKPDTPLETAVEREVAYYLKQK